MKVLVLMLLSGYKGYYTKNRRGIWRIKVTTYLKEDAIKMLIRYQNLDGKEELTGIDGVRTIMNRIGSIQYDPLNVVGRNADLVLQARIDNYKPEHLFSLLYDEHSLIDGVDKEMCIYCTRDFGKFTKVREAHTKSVISTLQHRNQMGALDIIDDVKAFVAEHGATGTKDISIGEVRESRWGHKKLSSVALDYLYNTGELCIKEKKGTQKYFDLTERIISNKEYSPFDDMSMEEFLNWYVKRRIACIGIVWDKRGGAWQGHYLDQNDLRKKTLNHLVENGEIDLCKIEGISEDFYAIPELNQGLHDVQKGDYTRFIAPLDNIMWDRTLLEKIFGFSYRWEVYTPVVKRKYGYYVIPVMYNNQFVARFEPEAISKSELFTIKNWWWEPNINPSEAMLESIFCELNRFAKFLGTESSKKNNEIIIAVKGHIL
ncbi:DNA glycosylase AlkZ-like family protein [Anaerosporobacter sp.]